MELSRLSQALREMGQHSTALVTVEEAVEIWRALARRYPGMFAEESRESKDLYHTLSNRGWRQRLVDAAIELQKASKPTGSR
jgi:hypothetical protein